MLQGMLKYILIYIFPFCFLSFPFSFLCSFFLLCKGPCPSFSFLPARPGPIGPLPPPQPSWLASEAVRRGCPSRRSRSKGQDTPPFHVVVHLPLTPEGRHRR